MKERLQHALPDLAAWLALALATLVVCWPLGLTNRILAGVDALTYFTPYWSFRMAAARAGQVPLWNPYLFSGAPFLANIQSAVLYPLHWPLSWLRAEQALAWSALLHVWLAAGFTYLLATRSLKVNRAAGLVAGLIFGLGGFTLARIENINQLNALAWLPALLWLYDETCRTPNSFTARWRSAIALTLVIALQFLAGHTQTTFINLVGLGAWAVLRLGWPLRPRSLARLLPLLAVLPALALCAAQLLPTLELNGLGLRTGGLDWRQASSFSLRPQLLHRTLLPPFGGGLDVAFGSEGYAEFVAYVGIVGLIGAGLGAWRILIAVRRADRAPLHLLVLAALGLCLALGRYNPVYYVLWRFVPGFDLFRAPARWMALYALGVALLAAWGLAHPHRPPAAARRASVVRFAEAWSGRAGFAPLVLLILLAELLLAGRAMPFAQATAPMATMLRNAPAALLAATQDQPSAGADRFLSLSNIRYDPGDLAELRALQANRLPAEAVERLVRAAKQVEVLAPNLPLFFRLPAVDGYDGGLLPLHRYVLLQQLFLPADRMTPDGRLAEQLSAIPDRRLLDLTGVRFVITDKQRDLWVNDVYYDLEQAAPAPARGELSLDLAAYPAFSGTAVGIIVDSASQQQAPARVTVQMADGSATQFDLQPAVASPASTPTPQILRFPANANRPVRIAVHNPGPQPLIVRGLSLIDERTTAHQSVTLSPAGDFRRIHSGDVKVYERVAAPGRAWLVHGIAPVPDAAAAQAALAQDTFDPRRVAVVEAVLPAAAPRPADAGETVAVLRFEPERVAYAVTLTTPGLLVMADAWYPGWQATVDGQAAPLLRANLLYRALVLQPGRHEVILRYAPGAWRTGVLISAITALLLAASLLAVRFIRLPAFLL